MSQPSASARSYASRTRAALPSRSPTTVLSWHSATRTRGMFLSVPSWSLRARWRFVTGTDAPTVEPTVEAVRMASRSLSRLLDADPSARDVLERLDARASPSTDRPSTRSCVGSVTSSSASPLAISSASIPSRRSPARSPTWRRTCSTPSVELAAADGLAVVGMGKLGGCELNYASDVDVMLVSAADVDPARRGPRRQGGGRHRPPVLPGRPQPATRRTQRRARAHARVLRGVLGPVGRAVGVPGAAAGASRRAATATLGARLRRRPRRSTCGLGRSPPSRCARFVP